MIRITLTQDGVEMIIRITAGQKNRDFEGLNAFHVENSIISYFLKKILIFCSKSQR